MNVVIFRDHNNTEKQPFEDALARLLAQHAPVLVAPHAYHIADDAELWAELAAVGGPLLALSWLHPRPTEWLLRRHGVVHVGLTAINMAAFESAEECFAECRRHLADAAGRHDITVRNCPAADRWHPVIDGSRCVNCKQCLRFCLFGVYDFDARFRVTVVTPDNCRPGCPACARICPNSAIMFPLYDKDDAIAGAPGTFVSPSDDARAMFERRTHEPYRDNVSSDADLDDLIDDLDRLARGDRS